MKSDNPTMLVPTKHDTRIEVEYIRVVVPGFEQIQTVAHRPVDAAGPLPWGVEISEYTTGRSITPTYAGNIPEAIREAKRHLQSKGLEATLKVLEKTEKINRTPIQSLQTQLAV